MVVATVGRGRFPLCTFLLCGGFASIFRIHKGVMLDAVFVSSRPSCGAKGSTRLLFLRRSYYEWGNLKLKRVRPCCDSVSNLAHILPPIPFRWVIKCVTELTRFITIATDQSYKTRGRPLRSWVFCIFFAIFTYAMQKIPKFVVFRY